MDILEIRIYLGRRPQNYNCRIGKKGSDPFFPKRNKKQTQNTHHNKNPPPGCPALAVYSATNSIFVPNFQAEHGSKSNKGGRQKKVPFAGSIPGLRHILIYNLLGRHRGSIRSRCILIGDRHIIRTFCGNVGAGGFRFRNILHRRLLSGSRSICWTQSLSVNRKM